MVVTASTFIQDTVKFFRDQLATNITDPISASRTGNRERFVMTSYPQRPVKYPIITVKKSNISQIERLGFQSEGTFVNFEIEIRVWARNVVEKDALSQQVHDFLRTNQFGGSNPSSDFGIHDFNLNSMVDVDEDGDNTPKSSVMTFRFREVIST